MKRERPKAAGPLLSTKISFDTGLGGSRATTPDSPIPLHAFHRLSGARRVFYVIETTL